jgi:hypothetical protein
MDLFAPLLQFIRRIHFRRHQHYRKEISHVMKISKKSIYFMYARGLLGKYPIFYFFAKTWWISMPQWACRSCGEQCPSVQNFSLDVRVFSCKYAILPSARRLTYNWVSIAFCVITVELTAIYCEKCHGICRTFLFCGIMI